MDVYFCRNVKSHELRDLFQSAQFSMEPKTILVEPVYPEPSKSLPESPKLLPAPVGEWLAPATGRKKSEDRNQRSEAGGQRSAGKKAAAADFSDLADGRENARPVNVTVNVTNGGGAGRGQKTDGKGQNRRGDGKVLAAIRKKTDLIPGLVKKVDATPRRTAAVLEKTNAGARVQGSGVNGDVSGRVWVKRVEAGKQRSSVTKTIDRKAIRLEVGRLIALGLSQTEACRQVAEQAQKGRAGVRPLTIKYDLPPVTWAIVRRVYLAKW